MDSISDLIRIAARIRHQVVRISHRNQVAHLGSSLSCIDILVAAYWCHLNISPDNTCSPGRDRLILSKGHAAAALYSCLAERGIIGVELLDDIGKQGCPLEEHPSLGSVAGVEASTGSLGHGLPMAVGMALAAKIQSQSFRVLAVLSDGECEEGAVWEAAMLAAANQLDSLIAVVDFNKWQATGRSVETMALEPLAAKWRAFGWNVVEVDGHDIQALASAMADATQVKGVPTVIVAHTVKGKGVSFMEDDNNWHYRTPTAAEVETARRELEQ